MRIEPYTVGSIVHVIKRGARGMNIVENADDQWRFVKTLFLLNDSYSNENWHRETEHLKFLERPEHWPERDPLVKILGWTLLSNHFHLLLQETQEGGIAKFMQRLGGSMSLCFNVKYKGQGSIFQGAYKARKVEGDDYFRYLIFYILVKNVFEMYPGGISAAVDNFDEAWEWALSYPFSSFSTHILKMNSPIIDDGEGLVENAIGTPSIFKKEAREMLLSYMVARADDLQELMLESW